ncbi:MAG: DNA translocase FtsK [Lachnospiraceae bacterium]|nr:DNA translocase FtsK [Lachnospiraceae bacterium]
MEGISNIRQRRRERREEETREYEEMLRRDEYAGSYDDEDEPGYDEEGYDGSGYDEDDPDAADDEDQQDFEFPEHLMTSGRIAERKTEYSDAERRRYLSRLRKEARKKQKESGDSFLSRLLNKYKSGNGHIEDTPEYKEFKEKYGVSDYEMSELIAGALQKTSRNMDAEGNYSEADLSAEDYSEEDFSEEPYDTTASGNANAEEEKDIVQKELDRKFGETPKIQVINLRERTQPAGGNTRHYFIDADPDSDDLLSTAELNEDLRKQVEHFFDDDQPASPENVDGLKKEGSYKNEKSSGNEGGFGNGESSANEGGGRNGENSGNEGGRNNEESLKNTISEKNGDIAENSLNSMNGGNAKSGDISEHGPVQKKISGENADPAGDRKNERDREVSGATGFNTPEQIKAVMEAAEEKKKNPPYEFPPYDLLKKNDRSKNIDHGELDEMVGKLQTTLESFGVKVRVGDATCGPTVTRYEIYPEQGVKVKNITALTDDIKLALAVPDIRIEAPIPGKAAVGIEVPNKSRTPVSLRELIDSDEFRNVKSKLAFAVGKDIGGKIICADIAAMPHALVAGSTGSGKSVCINSMILSILYKAKPSEVRLILIDPKRVELVGYNGIPHLLVPVVTDVKKAAGALNWAVAEMDDRYKRFEEVGVNNIETYNRLMEERYYDEGGTEEECPDRLPQILIIIDEFCDLMMTGNPKEVEATVGRLTQLARACGIHLVIATQRPAVNVITGTIKANIPSRISFSLTSVVDSRTILDQAGAEKLLGKGDMLFSPQGYPQPVRLQGAYVSDKEIADVVKYIKERCKENMYSDDISRKIEQNAAGDNKGQAAGNDSNVKSGEADDYRDELFEEAGRLIIENKKASIGSIQRKYRLGFNRAARIMDQLAEEGVVGPDEGTKPRQILMTIEQFEALIAGCNGDGGSTDDMDGNGTVTEE